MRTAVDTNVLLDLLFDDPVFVRPSRAALEEAIGAGPVVVCPAVYAELAACFDQPKDADRFLSDLTIQLDPFTPDSLRQAGIAWRAFARRRGRRVQCRRCGHEFEARCPACQSPVAWRQHILTDFLVGAHAAGQAVALLTRDRGYYKTYFPRLKLHVPAVGGSGPGPTPPPGTSAPSLGNAPAP